MWISYRQKILPSDQSRIIEQAKFTYSPWGKVFEKQRKTISFLETSWGFKSLKTRRKSRTRTNEAENEINEIKKMGRKGWAKRRRNIEHISKIVIVFILVKLV